VETENAVAQVSGEAANETASPFREIMIFGFDGLNDKKDPIAGKCPPHGRMFGQFGLREGVSERM
jgi:hypothetical protein